MQIIENCKTCGTTWTLVGGEWPTNAFDIHECPHCDINSLLNGLLNGTKIVENLVAGKVSDEYLKKIGASARKWRERIGWGSLDGGKSPQRSHILTQLKTQFPEATHQIFDDKPNPAPGVW
jgi:hypothetical protein